VLAVVHDDQELLGAQAGGECGGERLTGLSRHSYRIGHGLEDELVVRDRHEVDQPDAVGELRQDLGAHLQGEARLPHPAYPCQGEDRARLHECSELSDERLAPHEAGWLGRQVGERRIERPQGRERRVADREHPLRLRQVSQPVLAEIGHARRADDRGRRRGDEDLAPVARRHQPGGAVDRRSEVVPVPLGRLPRVHPHPHSQGRRGGPWPGREGLLRVHGGSQGVTRPCEHGCHPVASGREDTTAIGLYRRVDDRVVALQGGAHCVWRAFPKRRRPFDVGEHERHCAGWQPDAHYPLTVTLAGDAPTGESFSRQGCHVPERHAGEQPRGASRDPTAPPRTSDRGRPRS
jgi:hypothetical protein